MSPAIWKMNSQNKFDHENMIRGAIARNFELLEYTYDGHIGIDMLKEMITTSWSGIRQSNDYIRARHRGAEFLFSNLDLFKSESDEFYTTSTSKSVFEGQWLVLNLDRDNLPRMAIDEYHPLDKFPRLPSVKHPTNNKIFNKKFWILADDPQMVPAIATPVFIDHIMSIDQATLGASNGKKLFFIQGRRMHIILYTKRFFFEENKFSQVLARIEADVNCIKYILDVMLFNGGLFDPR